MSDPKRERGELRVPVLPEVLRPTGSGSPPPQLPVLSGPVSRRRRRRRPRVGLGLWLGLLVVAAAVGVTALVLAQPSGDRATATTTTPPQTTSTPGIPAAKPPTGPFRFAAVNEPRAVLTAVGASSAVLLGKDASWILGGKSGGTPVATITRLTAGRAAPAGSFEEPLAEAGFATSGGSLYLAGGYTGEKYGTAVLVFTPPSTTARLLARLPVALRQPAVGLLGGKLFVAGGRSVSGPTRSLYAVDLANGTVRSLAQLPRPTSGGALVQVGQSAFLLAGTRLYRIDPVTGRARSAGRVPARLRGAVSLGAPGIVVAGGRAYRLTPAG